MPPPIALAGAATPGPRPLPPPAAGFSAALRAASPSAPATGAPPLTPPSRVTSPPLDPSPATSPSAARATTPATAPGARTRASPVRPLLEAVESTRSRLDCALSAARRGRTFTAPELLALQADAYVYSQTVEVASRVVEQGAQAVKQAANTQV